VEIPLEFEAFISGSDLALLTLPNFQQEGLPECSGLAALVGNLLLVESDMKLWLSVHPDEI